MGKITGFMEYARKNASKRDALERLNDWKEQTVPLSEEALKEQAARCMSCGVPFCHAGVSLNRMTSGCPLHNLIPEFNDLVYRGKWHEAYLRLMSTNPFPEFTSRVCPAPCEGACTNGLHLEAVTIKQVEYAIIDKAYEEGWVTIQKGKPTSKSIAIVGSGPAGLSAAYFLTAVGHKVTVFEKDDRPGGLLMYGIPEMKLEKEKILRRVRMLEDAGVEFILNSEVGKEVPADLLISDYDAVLLATGAQMPRDLTLENRDLNGIHFAVDYLTSSTKSVLDHTNPSITAKDKHVLIIGGGDTGTDCVGTALRQGCKSVEQIEIMPEAPATRQSQSNPWPEWPKTMKVDYGQEEAMKVQGQDPRTYLTTATKLVGKDKIEEVHTTQIEWNVIDGRMTPVPVKGTEEVKKVDLVLLAMGFLGANPETPNAFKVVFDRSKYNPGTNVFDTNQEKVFLAGDMRRGQSLVVTALQEGKLVAKEIDTYLMGESTIH